MTRARFLSTAEVAERLGKTTRTVHRLVEADELHPIVKSPGLRGAYMFDEAEVEALAKSIGTRP